MVDQPRHSFVVDGPTTTYLQRVKAKYRQIGRTADTKLDLARRLAEDFARS